MPTGTVKFFNHKSKFGFIKDSESGEEHYVHAKHVEGTIEEGDEVTFTIEEVKRGTQAVDVVKTS